MDNYYTVPVRSSGEVISYTIENVTNAASLIDQNGFKNIQKVVDMINGKTIYPRFRIFALNPDETVNHEIPNEDIILGGSYDENYQNGQRRTLSFELINEDGKYTPSINGIWVNTRLALEAGLEVPETGIVVWFKKGTYVISSAKPTKSNDGRTVSIECQDKFGLLEGATGMIPETLEIPVNTEIEDIINDTIRTSMGNGYPLDPLPIIYHSSFKGKKTPLTLSLSAGSNWGSLITQLAEILSAEVFYNQNGNLTFVPIVEVTQDGDKPTLFDYDEAEGNYSDVEFEFGFKDYVNQIYVVGANINGHTCRASKANDDPTSPLSYQRIGYHTGQVINDSNITSDILAQERADYELRNVLIGKTTLTHTVLFNPLLLVNNLITFTDSEYKLTRVRTLIQSLSFSLDYEGEMTVTSSNINNLPFVTQS